MNPTPGFQAFADPNGNLWLADGWVAQLRSGIRLPVGSGADLPPLLTGPDGSRYVAAPSATGGTFIGGSGRNLTLSGLTPGPSGPALPVGNFQPARPNIYGRGVFTLQVTGSSAATIHDGTATVATLSTGGTAPVGSYASTAYGQSTYNGGSAFTLSAAAEQGAPGTLPDHLLSVSQGSAQTGTFSATDAATHVSDVDPDWTLVVAADGSAELLDQTTVVATRPAGSAHEAAGVFEATETGAANYNGGSAWRAFVQVIPQPVRAGFAYVEITEAESVLSAVSGPFLATALPADTDTVFHVPILQSDGMGGLVQFHTGLLCWPAAGGGSSSSSFDLMADANFQQVRSISLLGL